MKYSRWLWHALITVSAVCVGILTFMEILSPLRSLVTLWFLFICPGMAVVGLLRIEEQWVKLVLAVALSLAIDAVVAAVMVYTHLWLPKWGLVGLIPWLP